MQRSAEPGQARRHVRIPRALPTVANPVDRSAPTRACSARLAAPRVENQRCQSDVCRMRIRRRLPHRRPRFNRRLRQPPSPAQGETQTPPSAWCVTSACRRGCRPGPVEGARHTGGRTGRGPRRPPRHRPLRSSARAGPREYTAGASGRRAAPDRGTCAVADRAPDPPLAAPARWPIGWHTSRRRR